MEDLQTRKGWEEIAQWNKMLSLKQYLGENACASVVQEKTVVGVG